MRVNYPLVAVLEFDPDAVTKTLPRPLNAKVG